MRRVLIVLGVLVLGVVGAIAVLVATFDVNQYKPQIVQRVREATGREFDIKGDITIKPSLIPTLAINGVTLGNAGWSKSGPMATLEHVEVQIALEPLLDKRVEISEFGMRGVHVLLETNAAGDANWDLHGAKDKLQDGAASAPATPAPPAPANEARPLPIAVHAIALENIVVDYRPHTGKPQSVNVARLRLASRTNDDPIALVLATKVLEHDITAHGTLAPVSRWLADDTCPFDLTVASREVITTLKGEIAKPLSAPKPTLVFDVKAPALAAFEPFTGGKLPALAPVQVAGKLDLGESQVAVDDLALALGGIDAAGRVAVSTKGERPRVEATLRSKMIDLSPFDPPPEKEGAKGAGKAAAVPAAAGTAAAGGGGRSSSGGSSGGRPATERLLPETPLDLSALNSVDAKLDLEADVLKTRGLVLNNLKLLANLDHGTLDVGTLTAALEGGTLSSVTVLESRATPPHLRTRTHLKGMALARFFAGNKSISAPSGQADVALDIDGRGTSVAALLGSANGRIQVSAANLELANKAADFAGGDLLTQSLSMLNPMSKRSDHTTVECAVMNFPLQQGRMENKNGFGMRTDQMTILGGGTIDLASEKIDIGATPRPRSGIGLNLAGLADFLRLGGTLAHPTPVTDTAGAASAGLKIGAAIATGGISVLADSLLKRSEGDLDVCAIARGEAPPPDAKTGATSTAPAGASGGAQQQPANNPADAVRGVLKGLFGR